MPDEQEIIYNTGIDFKPFTKVLVHKNGGPWVPDIFLYKDQHGIIWTTRHTIIGEVVGEGIVLFEGNENLIGVSNIEKGFGDAFFDLLHPSTKKE